VALEKLVEVIHSSVDAGWKDRNEAALTSLLARRKGVIRKQQAAKSRFVRRLWAARLGFRLLRTSTLPILRRALTCGLSFVIFPADGAPCLLGLVVGTQGLTPDEAILGRPGHARKTKAICGWLNRRYGKGGRVAWAKQDPTRTDISLPDEIKKEWSSHKAALDRYGKEVYALFRPTTDKAATEAAVSALLDLLFEERGYEPLARWGIDAALEIRNCLPLLLSKSRGDPVILGQIEINDLDGSYELKKNRRAVEGSFVEVNCATVRGDAAMSALFGHVKGAFTGAQKDRPGLLRAADKGVLFLDEVGELGLDEQAMLLRALEEKTFLPLGSDDEAHSDFQLIAGTNRDLFAAVRQGRFREDLLARINLWTFSLPGLKNRSEDIEPNLDFELDRFAEKAGRRVTFSKEARDTFLAFALSPTANWSGNFRDLNAAVARMATLAPGGRISSHIVEEEIKRLLASWSAPGELPSPADLQELLDDRRLEELDLFDRAQLAFVVDVCRHSRSLSDAGRTLFSASRTRKTFSNDADRLRKYLARFGVDFARIRRNDGLQQTDR
jgi:MoxR-like ATPase